MAPVFRDTTQALVRQLDPMGDLIALRSIVDVSCFRPFCLVRRKRKGTLFWGAQYVKTDLSLRDVLESGTKLPAPRKDTKIAIQGNSEGNMEAGVKTAAIGIPVDITVSAGGSHKNCLEVQKLSIMDEMESLKKWKLKKPEPSFLKKLRERGENLYMVTEAVETLKDAKLEKGRKAGAGISIPLLTSMGLKGSFSFSTVMHVPLGSVLAFRLKQLVIGEKNWDISHLKDKKLKTFTSSEGPTGHTRRLQPEPLSKELKGFEALQAEVEAEMPILKSMTLEQSAILLEAILGLLGQAKALQQLEDTMNRALDLEEPVTQVFLGGPGDTILAKLQDISGKLHPILAGSFLYLLGALQELSEEQQQLLAMSVEKRILSQQLELMKTILDQNFIRAEAGPFRLHCELLQSFQGEELTVTQALIGLCGLDLQGDGPLYAWEPDALPPLCALYAALSVFQVLSRNSWFGSPFTRGHTTLGHSGANLGGIGKMEWGLGSDWGEERIRPPSPRPELPLDLGRLHLGSTLLGKGLGDLASRESLKLGASNKSESFSSISHEMEENVSSHTNLLSKGLGKAGVFQGRDGLELLPGRDKLNSSVFGLDGDKGFFSHSSLLMEGGESPEMAAMKAETMRLAAEFDLHSQSLQAEHHLLRQRFGGSLGPKMSFGLGGRNSKFF
ncbi:gasdermin-A-like isoform X2 [Petaurus breviceps papuanus]|uniref:gasdermin-A-like isoform X2 n=1 Tax=Petaurus breviceps papuanus TaxID=3040969 RepID=UPI0036DC16ED